MLKVQIGTSDFNYMRMLGKKGDKPTATVISLVSNIRKGQLLQYEAKLKRRYNFH